MHLTVVAETVVVAETAVLAAEAEGAGEEATAGQEEEGVEAAGEAGEDEAEEETG
jgi:hypothetical protein